MRTTTQSTANPPPRAVVLGVQQPGIGPDAALTSSGELVSLVHGLGIQVVGQLTQRRGQPGRLGPGKLDELRRLIGVEVGVEVEPPPSLEQDGAGESSDEPLAEPQKADLVIVDAPLRPGDAHHLEAALGIAVMDRPGVILEVFERRARTREAKLEIAIARLVYEAPRIRADQIDDGRMGGGGRGGRGHTNTELAKQEMRERLVALRRELEVLQRSNAERRARRSETPSVALVGYTNAGKSSWMRALTGSAVLVEDQLFATVGTTVRALCPPTAPRMLVSDTVGFIRNLPHALVASFKATLDEARDADLLLIVADASDPELAAHLRVTRDVLDEIGASHIESRLVLNKMDKVDEARQNTLAEDYPDALRLSVHRAADVGYLHQEIVAYFDQRMVDLELTVPYAKLGLLPQIHEHARVQSEDYSQLGVVIRARALPATAARLEALLAPPTHGAQVA